jgi:hypothetical protein
MSFVDERDNGEVIDEVMMWLRQTPEDFYQRGIKALVSGWRKAVEKDGDCVKMVLVNNVCDYYYTKFQLFPIIFG